MRRILVLALALAGCGSAAELKPPPGEALPPAPIGAAATPTAKELMTPTPQQRPQTVDELLTRSEARRTDEFDLPPGTEPDVGNSADRPQ
jgi:hypothetical protein